MRAIKPDYLAMAGFRQALRASESAVEEAARAAGLTPERHLLLLMVKGAPAGDERATISDLAERLRVAPHTVTGATRRAAAAGLVTRERCTLDRRRTWIRLTREGERRLEQVAVALEAQRKALVTAMEGVSGAGGSR